MGWWGFQMRVRARGLRSLTFPCKHRQLRAPARRAPALRMGAMSFHDLDALAVRCITDFLSPRQLAIATRTCHELCTACAGERRPSTSSLS